MSKEDLGILLTGAGVVVCLMLYLIDKSGKNTMAITIVSLILIGGLCNMGYLSIPVGLATRDNCAEDLARRYS